MTCRDMKKHFVALLAVALTLVSCQYLPFDDSQSGNDCRISGYAQKGQLNKGSQVTAFEIDANMVATGKSYPANITDALGSFSFAANVEAPYLEIRAEGYYFNEVTGENSEAPIYLEAIVPSVAGGVNVNLFTTLTKSRIKCLLGQGQSYSEAVGNAQKELLSALGEEEFKTEDFTDIDITGADNSDAVLLAYACIIQQNRTTSEIVTLIQNVATELENDGRLSAETVDAINVNKGDVNPFEVIRNIADFYTAKSIVGKGVPAFYRYLSDYYDAPFVIDSPLSVVPMEPSSRPHYEAISTSYDILSEVAFDVKCDQEFVTIRKQHILGNMYTVEVEIPENGGSAARDVEVVFVDKKGEELARRTFHQDAHLQMFELTIGSGTRAPATLAALSATFDEGDEIGVNGSIYSLNVHSESKAYVSVAPTGSYFFSYPAGSVSTDGHIARVAVYFPSEPDASTIVPYVAAFEPYADMGVPNPARVNLSPATALLGVQLEGFDHVESLVLVGKGDDDRLSGRFAYVYNTRDAALYPDLNTEMKKGSGAQVKLNYRDDSGAFYAPIPPVQLAQGFEIRLLNADGEVINTVEFGSLISFEVGKLYRLRIQNNQGRVSISYSIEGMDFNNDFTIM